MKLLGHDTSPFVRRVRVLLAEKAIPFVRDTHGWQNATPELLQVNPLMRVPVLLEQGAGQGAGQDPGDHVIIDSKLMATYLYDRYPDPPPAPPAGHPPLQVALWRADHRYDDENVVLAIDGAADSAINVFLMERDGVLPAASAYLRRQNDRIESCLVWLDRLYQGRTTLSNEALAFADIAVICALDWMAFRKRHEWSHHQNLRQMIQRHRERPSLAETHPARALHGLT